MPEILNSPLQSYQQALAEGFIDDPAQQHAVAVLQACFLAVHQQPEQPTQGVYLWGPVGRGKTWLMDQFYHNLRLPARRQHFHHFMRWVHRRLFQLTGTPEPLQVLAHTLAQEIRVLCLDEFFVSDIGDAMLLGPLVQQLFRQGTLVVTTSNQPPAQLYADGFHRDRFLPTITAIEQHMQVVAVHGSEDHRLHPGTPLQRYWVQHGANSLLPERFAKLSHSPTCQHPITLNHHRLDVVQHSQQVLWCSYAQLCETPLAANDYIELCDRFEHIFVSQLPCLCAGQQVASIARGTEDACLQVTTGDRQLPKQSIKDNGVRRFIALVDECYDRGVPLWLEAEVAMTELYPQGFLSFAFRRTLSRLQEMQLARFGQR
ncbi:cell division protein ZapE [Pontibacter sp. JAM-7]|uniref:cell division protein ZapE n=1 Tax=Pontibacter sp. JAM-7 TaxID=3366581 RepID=UPI003AF633A2